MRFYLFLLLSLTPITAFGILSHKDSVWEAWTDKQIEESFAPFEQTGITEKMLDQTMAWNERWRSKAYTPINEGMVRYRVVDSVIYQTHHALFENQLGVAGLRVLEEIIRNYPLPDVDFIYFDQDGPLGPLIAPNKSTPPGPIFASVKREDCPNVIVYHDWATPIPLHSVADTLSQGFSLLHYSWEYVIQEVEDGAATCSWEAKIPRLFWRGRASDRICTREDYPSSQRVKLVLLANQYSELMDVGFTGWWVNTFLKDIPELPPLKAFANTQEHMLYKYQLTIDGAAAQFPGYAWRLLSNCLVFKVDSPYKLWFEEGLEPGKHFIPIQSDLTDLEEKVRWAQEHDNEAHTIAENGRAFAQSSMMPEDVVYYCYKVLLKYASLQQFEVPKDDSRFEFASSPLTDQERAVRKEQVHFIKLMNLSH